MNAQRVFSALWGFFKPYSLPPLPEVPEWLDRRKSGESIYSIARSVGVKPSELVKRCAFEKHEAEDILDPIADLQGRVSKLEGK